MKSYLQLVVFQTGESTSAFAKSFDLRVTFVAVLIIRQVTMVLGAQPLVNRLEVIAAMVVMVILVRHRRP
jgi:hypothetical protein